MNDADPSDDRQPPTESMSTDTDTATDDQHATSDDQPAAAGDPTAVSPTTDGGETVNTPANTTESNRDIARYVNYAVLGGLCLLAFVAALQFYLSASQAINIWVTREYRPVFQAVFNVAIVLLAGTGIAFQLRRLYGE